MRGPLADAPADLERARAALRRLLVRLDASKDRFDAIFGRRLDKISQLVASRVQRDYAEASAEGLAALRDDVRSPAPYARVPDAGFTYLAPLVLTLPCAVGAATLTVGHDGRHRISLQELPGDETLIEGTALYRPGMARAEISEAPYDVLDVRYHMLWRIMAVTVSRAIESERWRLAQAAVIHDGNAVVHLALEVVEPYKAAVAAQG